MAWSASGIFRSFVTDTLAGTAVFDLDAPSDTYRIALYNNTPVPSKDATSANSRYDLDQWVTANEVWEAVQWPQKGQALVSMTLTAPASNTIRFDAADTASGSAATLANVYGTLCYNDTKTTPVVDQAVVFNYLGGPNSVSGGTLTIVWNSSGLFQITV